METVCSLNPLDGDDTVVGRMSARGRGDIDSESVCIRQFFMREPQIGTGRPPVERRGLFMVNIFVNNITDGALFESRAYRSRLVNCSKSNF